MKKNSLPQDPLLLDLSRNKPWHSFADKIDAAAARKLKARQSHKSVWFGLGMFGLVGWSVAVPTLLGIALGLWIDGHFPSQYSWTLMLLLLGIGLGCFNAWYWVQQESHHD